MHGRQKGGGESISPSYAVICRSREPRTGHNIVLADNTVLALDLSASLSGQTCLPLNREEP